MTSDEVRQIGTFMSVTALQEKGPPVGNTTQPSHSLPGWVPLIEGTVKQGAYLHYVWCGVPSADHSMVVHLFVPCRKILYI